MKNHCNKNTFKLSRNSVNSLVKNSSPLLKGTFMILRLLSFIYSVKIYKDNFMENHSLGNNWDSAPQSFMSKILFIQNFQHFISPTTGKKKAGSHRNLVQPTGSTNIL